MEDAQPPIENLIESPDSNNVINNATVRLGFYQRNTTEQSFQSNMWFSNAKSFKILPTKGMREKLVAASESETHEHESIV